MIGIFPGAARRPSPGKPKWARPDPTKMITEWPPSRAIGARWATEGNFWTHARSIGRENPWDLIIFNFQTQDPYEVNWYLHHAVGCWRLDPTRNFMFDSALTDDGEDGIIYLPPISWRPPAHFSKGSGAGTFMMGIRHRAAAILRSLSARMPTITHGATSMRPHDYSIVANLIETGEVTVEIDPDLGAKGGYLDEDKALRLSFSPMIGNAEHASTLANEAVHVATHYHEIKHNVLRNEYVSTVAGAIAMGVTNERTLDRYVNPRRFTNWGYYYAGWVWINLFKPRGYWMLSLSDLDEQYEHPYLSTTANPFSELKGAMSHYSRKSGAEVSPEW